MSLTGDVDVVMFINHRSVMRGSSHTSHIIAQSVIELYNTMRKYLKTSFYCNLGLKAASELFKNPSFLRIKNKIHYVA